MREVRNESQLGQGKLIATPNSKKLESDSEKEELNEEERFQFMKEKK